MDHMQHFIQMLPAPRRSRLQIADAMCGMSSTRASRSQPDGCQMNPIAEGVQSDLLEPEEFTSDLFAAKISPFCILSHFSDLSLLVNVKPFRWMGARCTDFVPRQSSKLSRDVRSVRSFSSQPTFRVRADGSVDGSVGSCRVVV